MRNAKIAAYKKARALQMADFLMCLYGLTGKYSFKYQAQDIQWSGGAYMPDMKHVSKRQKGEFKHKYAKGHCSVFSYYSALEL